MLERPLARQSWISRATGGFGWPFYALAASFCVLYVQLYWKLATGPWQTEQEGHGPFLLAGAAFIAYIEYRSHQDRLQRSAGRIVIGTAVALVSAFLAIVGQSQDVTMIAAGSQVFMLGAIIVSFFGFYGLRLWCIPLLLVGAATPPPGYLVDAVTVRLKEQISDAVVWLLYHLGFDIAQNGVIIQAGPYELLVKDACAGMNSIFALSALSLVYIYIRSEVPFWQKITLVIASLPIAIISNFFRVLTLCLVTFEFGLDNEHALHDVTGILLFVVAGILFFAADMVLTLFRRLFNAVFRANRRSPPPPISGSSLTT